MLQLKQFIFTVHRLRAKAKDKVIELTRILSERVGPIKLHIVPFTELQKQINKVVHPRYTMTSTRRIMMRVADAFVHKIGAHAIVNGENLGQVASQTLKVCMQSTT